MTALVTGATGMLGRDIVPELAGRGHDVTALGHQDLDITDVRAARECVAGLRPDIVVNCAAYTRVDDAEREKAAAFDTNALGPRNLALASREARAILLHISTDYVFDGAKEDPYTIWDAPSPINVYGISKSWGENYIRSLLAEYYLVRTSWLFGSHGRNFVGTMLEVGRERARSLNPTISVVADQHGSPTYTVDLAKACADLLETGCFGIYHVTNQGVTTWCDFAKTVFEKSGLAIQ
ncbi:MAG: dTDP-4-dehydrorhamnose reductase, partial [Pirellulales bacterium]|nr:dTDP-4-dehydrorhamnose reductase [Pirellulales bacterium]